MYSISYPKAAVGVKSTQVSAHVTQQVSETAWSVGFTARCPRLTYGVHPYGYIQTLLYRSLYVLTGLLVRGPKHCHSIPSISKEFISCPKSLYRPWGPHIRLCNGWWSCFPEEQSGRSRKIVTHPRLLSRLKTNKIINSLSLMCTCPAQHNLTLQGVL
jgi:hypothetical protein